MKLRKLHVKLLLALICLPGSLLAQNVEDIINKHIEAHGGYDKWNKVEALKITGRFTAFSLENDFTTYKTKCGAFYSDLFLGNQRVIEGFKDNCGWTIDPWFEIYHARNINEFETNVFHQKSEFFTPFLNYKEKGHKVELLGKENVEGSDMYVLQLTRANGMSEKWFLDANTYLEFKCEANWVDFARSVPAEMYYDDFREVDGLILPFFVERIFSIRDRITQIEKVEVNPKIDMELFDMPKRKEIAKLNFMNGNWDVKLEFVERNGQLQDKGNTESHIEYASTNMLKEKISYEQFVLKNLSTNFTFDQNSNKYRIVTFNDFTSSFEVYQGELKDNVLVLDDMDISYSKKVDDSRTYSQYTYTKVDDDNFTLETKISSDAGKTWKPQARFTYKRKTDSALSQK